MTVSRIGLGMMSFGDPAEAAWYLPYAAAEPIVRRAVEAGVTFFDTADMYSGGTSEEITGALLRKHFRRREEYVLGTKVYYPMGAGPNDRGLSRKHIMAAIDASLRRLGTDHVDLYQVHRFDPYTPVAETMDTLGDLVRAGKVRYLGASLMYAWQLATAQFATGARFASMQTRWNLLYREEEREVVPFCADQGIGVLPYSPLAQGLLARPPTARPTARAASTRPPSGNDERIRYALRSVATARGTSPATVALAWLLGKPAVVAPILGVTRPAHLDDAVAALDLTLTDAEIAAVEEPYRPREPYGYT